MGQYNPKNISLLFLTAISSFGDVVFLTGVPLYLYRSSGGRLTETTYIMFLITLTVFLMKRYIIKINKKNPLLVIGWGEISMAGIELLLLGCYSVFHSKWIVVFGTVPLAALYNTYAPSKKYRIQEYFFENDLHFWTAIQSGFDRMGRLLGVACSGLLAEQQNLSFILLIDASSFLFFWWFLFGYLSFFYKTKSEEHS